MSSPLIPLVIHIWSLPVILCASPTNPENDRWDNATPSPPPMTTYELDRWGLHLRETPTFKSRNSRKISDIYFRPGKNFNHACSIIWNDESRSEEHTSELQSHL